MCDDEPVYIDFTVRGLAVDPRAGVPVLLLQDHARRVVLPIWIGEAEAAAIAMELQGVVRPRPMTHDLLKQIVEAFGAQVTRVDIRALDEGTFYATLVLTRADGTEIAVDSRPSDAIALAVRSRAAIRVAGAVLEAAQAIATEERDQVPAPAVVAADDDEARAALLERLAAMDDDDFGKYKM